MARPRFGSPCIRRRISGRTTSSGRGIAVVVMLVGIGSVAVLTTAAAERFMRGHEAQEQRAELLKRLCSREW